MFPSSIPQREGKIKRERTDKIEIDPQVDDLKVVKALHPMGQTAAVAKVSVGLKTKKNRRPGAAKPRGAFDLVGDFPQQDFFVKGQQRFGGDLPMAVLLGDPQPGHGDVTDSLGGQQCPQLIAGKTAFA